MNIGMDYSDDFLIGHSGIDREHRSLFEKAQRILQQFLNNSPRIQIVQGMRDLHSDLQNLFTREEAILDALDYPRLAIQKEQHRSIMTQATRTLDHYEAQSMSFGDLYSLLHGVIVKGHFLSEDMRIKPFLGNQ